ncbi:MAG: TonB-dependent receptor plug domain-containing protein [Paludibacter sp.]|nr:TonB-dependent receptor plug domain-containing protein [Paludibacter sp.]
MKLTTCLFFFLFFVILLMSAQNFTISGSISDSRSGETMISSSVYDIKSENGTVSNSFGFYSLTLPKGDVKVQFSYVGYADVQKLFKLTKDTTINIRLDESTVLNELTVVGNRQELGVQGSQMSAIEVPISQIKSVPTLFGETDVIKALQLLPGVKAGTEGAAGLYVRGGGPDENLFLLDGVPVYNVNHAFGFFSVFNADAIKNVTLYKGSFPARFGGRLSSVVDIRMKDGDNKKYHGNISVGLISSKANVEGPLFNEKTSFNFSARRTYADLLLMPIIKTSAGSEGMKASGAVYFYDLNLKVNHKISDKDRIYLSAYMGDDVISTKFTSSESYDNDGSKSTATEELKWNWGNIVTALRWNHVLTPKLFMNATTSYTRYRYDMGIGAELEVKNNSTTLTDYQKVGFKSGIEDFTAKVDFDYSPAPNHDIKFGVDYTNHTFKPGVQWAKQKLTMEGMTLNMDTTIGDQNILGHETALYFEDNISINRTLKANLGLNYSAFFVQGEFYQSLQPRLGLRLLASDQLSFKAGFADMSQYIHLLSNSSISLPTDLWVPVTKRVPPMKSYQYSAGAFYSFPNIVELSIEGYYKSMDNLIEYKDGASFLGSSTGWEDKINMGRGWAYGIEFLAQKTIGRTTGWIGYTWSKAERLFNRPGEEINNGQVFPAKYDRRHDISIVASYKLSEKIDFSATWVYNTGNAATLALQSFASGDISDGRYQVNTSELPYISKRNNFRYNDYHRLDLGVNFHKQKKYGIRTWNISVYNAYNQLNPFIVYKSYNYDAPNLTQLSLFPIIPSVSYSYKF